MKQLLLVFLCSLFSLHALSQCNGRYYDQTFGFTATSDVVYGQNENWFGQNEILKMDIYEPANDTLNARPLIFFTHGGSFIAGTKTDGDVVELCERFAQRGYVTVSINYRVGFFPIDSLNAARALVRAVQDQKAAIRFFKQDASTSNTYGVDTNQIWVGGSSAGAVTGMHCAYLDQAAEVPVWIDINSMGGLEGNSGVPGYSSDFRGVVDLCGALKVKEWMEMDDKPMVGVHGTADNVVPYGHDYANILGVDIILMDGSGAIEPYSSTVSTDFVLKTFNGAGHVPFAGTSSDALLYMDSTDLWVRDFIYTHLDCYQLGTVVAPILSQTQLLIFPNPGSQVVQFEFSSLNTEKVSARLVDLRGKILCEIPFIENGSADFNLQEVSAGIYSVQILNEHGVLLTTGKLIKAIQ